MTECPECHSGQHYPMPDPHGASIRGYPQGERYAVLHSIAGGVVYVCDNCHASVWEPEPQLEKPKGTS